MIFSQFSSWGSHLSSFFNFPICFTCWKTIEWLTLSSLATSHVVIRESAFMMALNWSLSPSDGCSLCSSSSRFLSPLQNFLNHHCTVHSLVVPGQNLFWCCRLSLSDNWWPIFNSNTKMLEFAFCLTSFSLVQSLSRVRLFATPWITACQASLSITNSHSLLKLMSIESVMPSSHLSSPSPPAPHPSQQQGLFQWVNSLHEVAKVLELQLQHRSFQWIFKTDLL